MSLQESYNMRNMDYCFHGDFYKVRELLEDYGADPNYQDTNGQTPLMKAVLYGHLDVVKLLLQHDADPNIKDYGGRTALSYIFGYHDRSALRKYNIILQLLLNIGIEVNIRGYNGNTPLMSAVRQGNIIGIELLLRHGANPFIEDDWGDTAYDYAIGVGESAPIELLKKFMTIYRMQALKRGNLTRRKLRTSMARRRSALNQVADEYGLEEEIIHMLNSHITGPTRLDVIDEMPRDILLQEQRENQRIADYLDDLDQYGSGKRSSLSNRRKRTRKRLY